MLVLVRASVSIKERLELIDPTRRLEAGEHLKTLDAKEDQGVWKEEES